MVPAKATGWQFSWDYLIDVLQLASALFRRRHGAALRRIKMQQQATTNAAPRYIDDRAAARYLNVSTSTLAKWRMRGFGPTFHRFGALIRYTIADLDAYAEQSRSA
jgi:hypothetical protein